MLDAGDTGLVPKETVSLEVLESINLSTYGRKASYEPTISGITAVSLDSESFLSAASFQETTKVLSSSTLAGRTDFLRGLKERVVVGEMVHAGTGMDSSILYDMLSEEHSDTVEKGG